MTQIRCFLLLLLIGTPTLCIPQTQDEKYITYTADPSKENVGLFWKDDKGEIFQTFRDLEIWLNSRGRKLRFAMNGGMYMTDYAPLGLFIQDQKVLGRINKRSGKTNFYIQPNGIFCITTDKRPYICTTNDFNLTDKVNYATQSGPMLLIKGVINPVFDRNPDATNRRNGVGILPGNKIAFVISKVGVTFYEFAEYFKQLQCTDALYLDGGISEIYYPKINIKETTGDFGVIIGITY
jgi:uncharacterized protein YigE (DUF2233 family)